MAFSYTTADGQLTAYEGFGGYYLRLNGHGVTVSMGDGVGWYFDDDGAAYEAGSPELHAALVYDLENNTAEWLEAYYGITED